MSTHRIIGNLHFEATIRADFNRCGQGIFLANRKEHFTCGGFFGVADTTQCHRTELFLALWLVLFGKSCVSFVADNTLFILRNGLREVFEYPVLKVVMLG